MFFFASLRLMEQHFEPELWSWCFAVVGVGSRAGSALSKLALGSLLKVTWGQAYGVVQKGVQTDSFLGVTADLEGSVPEYASGHALAVHRMEHWCGHGPSAVHLPMVHTSRANDSAEAFSRLHYEALVRARAAHHLQPEHAPLLLHCRSATKPQSRTQGATIWPWVELRKPSWAHQSTQNGLRADREAAVGS